MKITTTGSLGNVGQPLVKLLVAAGHEVTVITSHTDRQAAIEALGARAAIGSITDQAFLTQAFKGADAVYTMTPPAMGQNIIENIATAGAAYAEAIKQAGVKRVVMLSSIGADAPEGTGPVKGVYLVEQIYQQKLADVNLTIVRAGNFYNNYLRDIPLIKSRGVLGSNFSGDERLVLTHPNDIAATIAAELQSAGNGINIKYIVSDITTGTQVAAMLGEAIGNPQLPWIEFTDEQIEQGMQAAGLPAELVGLITEMGRGMRERLLTKDFFDSGAPVNGTTKLADFAEEFKARYQQA